MKKVKLQLPTQEWQNISSKYAPDDSRFVDQNAFTSGTKNIDTELDGTIRKMKGGVEFAALANPAADQHEAIFSDGTRHLMVVENGTLKYTAGVASMSTVTGGYSTAGNFEFATMQNRVYFGNGINPGQAYDKTATYGGVGYTVPQTKVMGAQPPGSAPTTTIVAGAGVPAGTYTYKVTFLYYGSEESNGGPTSSPSVTVIGGPNQQVDLTVIPTGGYGTTARKIYRDGGSGYVLIGTISDNTTTTFSDNAAAGTTPIPTDNGIPPVFGQVKLFLDRLWLAQISGEPFTLYFTEVGAPDIVESTNYIDCNPEDPITALYVYRGRLIVFNRRSMGQILGDTKDSFAYDPIEGSVGCVDNRTVQEITLNGVPILVWLSDKGIYGFNGSSIFYLSEDIEDTLKSNLRQTVVQKNEKVDSTDADFNAGTASDGIAVAGGQISVRGYVDGTPTVGNNPRRTWDDTADWDGGTLDNVATIGLSNVMQPVQDFSEEPATEGTKDNVIASGVGITLEGTSDFTGETSGTTTNVLSGFVPGAAATKSAIAWPFIPTRTGTLDSVTAYAGGNAPSAAIPGATTTYRVNIHSDSFGSPGAIVGTSGDITVSVFKALGLAIFEMAATAVSVGSPTLTGGSKYHVSIAPTVGGVSGAHSSSLSGGSPQSKSVGLWLDESFGSSPSTHSPALAYTFTTTATATSGTWKSTVYDSQSTSADAATIAHTSSFPAGTGATTRIEAGDALDFTGNLVVDETQEVTDLNGSAAVTLGTRRYWQVSVTLTTNDDRVAPTVSTAVTLDFSQTAEWISDSVDTTGDSTVYDSLVTGSTTPGSSTVVTEIRTAATEVGLAAAPWGAFGGHVVRQWAQFRITMTKDGSNTPSTSSLEFKWTIVSNLISATIDTNVDPAGWDVFQSTFSNNGGTVVFDMRSAAAPGGLAGATWYTVTNGNFPTASLPTDQYVQWRATLTADDTNVPTVSSVTTTWFIGDVGANVRAASIFDSKNYFVSLAELGTDINNVLIQLDAKGKWRIKRGLGINTFGFFFNEVYFGSSTSSVMGKFLTSFQDLGTDIEVDIRTRAFDFSEQFFGNSEFEKVPESIILEGRGTGATYDVSYSLDNGTTFTSFKDSLTGSTTFTTTNDDELFARIFRVDVENDGLQGARTIMYRIHTNDEYDVKLHRIKAAAFVTRKEPFITG